MRRWLRWTLAIAPLVMLLAPPAEGATKWRSVEPEKSPGKVCVAVGEEEFTYDRLDKDSPLAFTVSGPRRVKIVTRYLYGENDPERADYTVRVIRDGVAHVRRAISTVLSEPARRCGRTEGDVGQVRRLYLDVPKGRHTYQVFVVEADREVAARVFRQVKVRGSGMVSLTPSQYTSIYTLQFESGALSAYYGFESGRPLAFEVIGPTKIQVCTRLEFTHAMNGSQSYGIEVVQDGEKVKVYQYHVRKMETVSYVEHPEVLPAVKKCFSIRVPKGRHLYELRPANGSGVRAAARIYIPKADLGRTQ